MPKGVKVTEKEFEAVVVCASLGMSNEEIIRKTKLNIDTIKRIIKANKI